MFFDREDDEHDFMSPGGSKLGALFGIDKAGNKGGNESLTYTAPKQPKKKESTPPGKAAPSVAFAVAVHAYKYAENKYDSQGKMGAAILANHATNEYSILMYVTQQQKVTTAKISSSFVFTCQANNYANFYDDVRQSWSILFDNEQNATDFAKHVCITKALSTGATPTTLTTQDLTAGEGGALESGDSVEVKYTGWLLTNNTFGQVFDSNVSADKLFRFKIGAGKVIKGWENGAIGMKKNGKRLLVIPPSLAYGSQGMGSRVPPSSTLIFEVEIIRVKLVGRESTPSPAQPPPQPNSTQSQSQTLDDFEDENQTVKGRTKSISDQLSHSPIQDTSKAKLISRMAKMGKPMLPFSGAVPAGTESDDEPVPASPQPLTSQPQQGNTEIHRPVPVTVSQPVQQVPVQQQQQPVTVIQAPQQPAFLQNIPGAQQMALYQPQQNFMQPQQQQPPQQTLYQPGYQPQMYGNQPQPGVPGTVLPPYIVPGMSQGQDMMLLSEARQQNTEVRLTLSKVSDKVDQVMQKLDQSHSQTSSTAMLPNMETSVLLHNITRIVQENERLKKDVFEKSGKIEDQNDKISDLLQRNQSYVEKSQVLMEQRNEGFLSSTNQNQNRVLSLEQEKVQLTKQLTDTTSQISTLQLEVSSLKKKEFELGQQVSSTDKQTRQQTDELENLKSQHEEDESRLKELQRLLKEEKQNRKIVENNSTQVQEEMSDLQTAKQLVEKNLLDRKKKAAEERRQMEDEMEDVKANFEAEVQSLKEKLRKQKTSSSTASQEQTSQIEAEINSDWQKKSDKLLAAAAEKHSRALTSVKEEKEELEAQIQELEKRVQSLKTNSSGSDQRLTELQEQVEELSAWKDKYDSLRTNATTMKERYETRIQEIEEERDSLEEQVSNLEAKVETLESVSSATAGSSAESSQNLLDEVKKIMNTVYREMRETFESDNSYSGSEILSAILKAIKSTTLSLMNKAKEESATKDEQSEEEDEEEEEEEEEDGEEEEEEEDGEEETNEKEEEVKQEKEADTDDEEEEEEEKQEVEKIVPDKEKETHNSEVNSVSAEQSEHDRSASKNSDNKNDNQEGIDTSEVKVADNTEENTSHTVEENTSHTVEENTSNKLEQTEEAEVNVADNTNDQQEEIEDTKAEPVIVKPLRKADSLDDLLNTALENKPATTKPPPIVSTEPPPLSDESTEEEGEEVEKDKTKSIFAEEGDDDIVADTLGFTSDPLVNGKTESKADKKTDKSVLSAEEDLKPAPPPPLFGDDDDDDDLDWLS